MNPCILNTYFQLYLVYWMKIKKQLLNTPQEISKTYLDSRKIGISLSAKAALINIAKADNRPNNTVGLKLEKTKTKNPMITVKAVINTA